MVRTCGAQALSNRGRTSRTASLHSGLKEMQTTDQVLKSFKESRMRLFKCRLQSSSMKQTEPPAPAQGAASGGGRLRFLQAPGSARVGAAHLRAASALKLSDSRSEVVAGQRGSPCPGRTRAPPESVLQAGAPSKPSVSPCGGSGFTSTRCAAG